MGKAKVKVKVQDKQKFSSGACSTACFGVGIFRNKIGIVSLSIV